jgi:hypothetical protein
MLILQPLSAFAIQLANIGSAAILFTSGFSLVFGVGGESGDGWDRDDEM